MAMYIGGSATAEALRYKIDKARRNRFPVLITGETGVGKDIVAREVHGQSSTPFVKIDCASLVSSLVETELQGHIRGAFTGAESNRKGLVAAADGGTLFLDEVGELPTELQAKFLTILQDRVVRPVGSVMPQAFDCRIISATNRDLRADVESGRFRRDLYYRLKVVSIRVPPLREHVQDVPELIQHFLDIYAPQGFTVADQVIGRFMAHDWPGNIRELQSCIQVMCANAEGSTLNLGDIPSQLVSKHSVQARRTGSPGQIAKKVVDNEVLLATIRTVGSKARAARLLDIGRSTLYRRLGPSR